MSGVATLVLVVLVGGYLTHRAIVTPVQAAVRFEVRLAEEQPQPGLVVAQVADSGQLVYLHSEVIVGNEDIANTWVTETASGRYDVSVEFFSSATDRVRQATAGHLGRPVAIVIDGRVVMAPVVRSPIGESAVITGRFTRAEADRIAGGIRGQ